ncbi:MAG TPA: hypothetical protein VGS80_08750, partial [Ktedonobacterales bacterium]|nr:hypothetical protein [Ktedonobacterales bacterium]
PMDRRFTHPEWSVQVWGRCRARMLLAHGAPGRAEWTGMLALAPGSVVACKTDGLYLATDPGWPDDGRPGRLRLKRQLPGPISWPQDWAALADLKQHLDAQLRAQVETVEQEQIV